MLSDDEDDGEYSPDEDDYKKTIMVGNEFQAVIPDGLCQYDDALPYENDDKLLWDPKILIENDIEQYLRKANTTSHQSSTATTSTSTSAASTSSTVLGIFYKLIIVIH